MTVNYEKVYRVTFNSYTNYSNDTVSLSNGFERKKFDIDKEYLHIPKYGLVIRESELEFYRRYGDGFESIKLVGEMPFMYEKDCVKE